MALPSTLRDKCGKTIFEDFKVVRLLPDGQAVVSVKGLCRLVIQPAGRVLYEFVDREFAQREIAKPLFAKEGEWTEAIDYETGKVLNFDNRGLSEDPRERSYQLDYFSCGLHKDEDTVKVQRRIYHRAKGSKLGRLLPGPAKQRPESVKLFKPAKQVKKPFRSASKQKAS
jgi:hypothetical protein